jgi:glycylpeptide N-tetradecanoyltransferase
MIKELTRRVNLTGIFQGIYTAGRVITAPLCTTQYHHRLVNFAKLVAIKFTSPEIGIPMPKQIKSHELPKTVRLPGFRVMIDTDVAEVTTKLNEYLSQYKVGQIFSEEQVRHWFLPRQGIVGSYVVEKGKQLTAFVSFYLVPSTVTNVPEYDSYMSAYLFYYFSKPSELTDVIRAAMEVAHHEFGADVINCLNLLENGRILSSLKFVAGDGKLNYYIYNYGTEPVKTNELGVVLL